MSEGVLYRIYITSFLLDALVLLTVAATGVFDSISGYAATKTSRSRAWRDKSVVCLTVASTATSKISGSEFRL